MATKKSGRPTESTKDYMLRVRMDNSTLEKLDECCSYENLSRSEVVRKSIVEYHKKINK